MGVIVREWRGRVQLDRLEDYLAYVERTGLRDSADTPGHLGSLLMTERGTDTATVVVLSLWDSYGAIQRFAGDDIARARYYPEDVQYLLAMPERLNHYNLTRCDVSGLASFAAITAVPAVLLASG